MNFIKLFQDSVSFYRYSFKGHGPWLVDDVFQFVVDLRKGGKISGLLGGILQNVAKQPLQVTTGINGIARTQI